MMSSAYYFTTECLGRVILIAILVAGARREWWEPLVAVPVCWQVWDGVFGRRSRIYAPGLKLVADGLTWLIWLWYIGYTIFSMGKNVGHWYGWVLGLVLAIVVAQLFGLLFPKRWHFEGVEGTL